MKEELIAKTMLNMLLEEFKDKIDLDNDLSTYLMKVEKEKLCVPLGLWSVFNNDKDMLGKLNKKSKKKVIEFIINNLEDIYTTCLIMLTDNAFEEVKLIINEDGYLEYNAFEKPMMSIKTIELLKYFNLAFIDYNNDGMMKIHIPDDLLQVIKECLKKPLLKEKRAQVTKIGEFMLGVLEAYGIIEGEYLCRLYLDQGGEISEEELACKLLCKAMLEEVEMLEHDGKYLFAILAFPEEDDSIEFYENRKGEYYDFSYDDFISLGNKTYMKTLKSYKRIEKYLQGSWDLKKSDIEVFEAMVHAYLYFAQTDRKLAEAELVNAVDVLELDNRMEKERIANMIKALEYEYPKWQLKGNTLKKGTVINKSNKVGRNEPCPCGSGKKYKKCCGK